MRAKLAVMKERSWVRVVFEVGRPHVRRRVTTLNPADKSKEEAARVTVDKVGRCEVEEVTSLVSPAKYHKASI